jgi:inner membrane protease subunit 2
MKVFGYVAKVEGQSMQPQLNPDNNSRSCDYVFLYNWPIITNSFNEIERGEVIALVSPRDPKQRLIKRVIGLSVSFEDRMKNECV